MGKKDSWRRKRKRTFEKSPTEGELQHLINLEKIAWDRIDRNWSCPICNRTKLQVVRKSKDGKWFINSCRRRFYDAGSPSLYQDLQLCRDCGDTAQHIGIEAKERASITIDSTSALISAEELQKVITGRNHNTHAIDNDAVDALLDIIGKRIVTLTPPSR